MIIPEVTPGGNGAQPAPHSQNVLVGIKNGFSQVGKSPDWDLSCNFKGAGSACSPEGGCE